MQAYLIRYGCEATDRKAIIIPVVSKKKVLVVPHHESFVFLTLFLPKNPGEKISLAHNPFKVPVPEKEYEIVEEFEITEEFWKAAVKAAQISDNMANLEKECRRILFHPVRG